MNIFLLSAGTPYAGGLFRVKLVLGKDFPRVPPKGFFLTKVFHPNVANNGEICVNTLKRDWKADLGIKHLLLVSSMYGIQIHIQISMSRVRRSHIETQLLYLCDYCKIEEEYIWG